MFDSPTKQAKTFILYLRERGQQEAEHGYESYHHTAVLPHIFHTLLQQVEDPRRPVDTQGPAGRWRTPVTGCQVRTLPGETCCGHEVTPGVCVCVSPVR